MMMLIAIFVTSVLHEVLSVAYMLAVTNRRPMTSSILSGVLAGVILTVLVGVAEHPNRIAAVVTCAVAHSIGAYVTTRWMPKKEVPKEVVHAG